MKYFTSLDYKIFVANQVNKSIVEYKNHFKSTCSLEKLVQQSTIVRDLLYQESCKEKTKMFTKWSLDTFLQQ